MPILLATHFWWDDQTDEPKHQEFYDDGSVVDIPFDAGNVPLGLPQPAPPVDVPTVQATFLQTSGAISMSQINAVWGLGNSLSAYRGKTWYKANGTSGTFPSTNLSFNNFYGTGPAPNIAWEEWASSCTCVLKNQLGNQIIKTFSGGGYPYSNGQARGYNTTRGVAGWVTMNGTAQGANVTSISMACGLQNSSNSVTQNSVKCDRSPTWRNGNTGSPGSAPNASYFIPGIPNEPEQTFAGLKGRHYH